MKIPEWLRKAGYFLPNYGQCGGASASCAPIPPIDAMDLCFQEHDMSCYSASMLGSQQEVEKAKSEADHILHDELEKIDTSKLSFYGKLYRLACLIVFK